MEAVGEVYVGTEYHAPTKYQLFIVGEDQEFVGAIFICRRAYKKIGVGVGAKMCILRRSLYCNSL